MTVVNIMIVKEITKEYKILLENENNQIIFETQYLEQSNLLSEYNYSK